MRVFEKPNLEGGWKCPICNTDEIKEIVLVTIDGTTEGNITQAQQYHLECIELTQFDSSDGKGFIIAMGFDLQD